MGGSLLFGGGVRGERRRGQLSPKFSHPRRGPMPGHIGMHTHIYIYTHIELAHPLIREKGKNFHLCGVLGTQVRRVC